MSDPNYLEKLNLPAFPYRIKNDGNKRLILDMIRKKYVALTPEEWVRQHIIYYLISEKKYPRMLLSVEMPFKLERLNKRSDVVVFDRNGNPLMIVECKAPDISISQKVFEQISIYNMKISAVCLMVTNGMQHYCMKVGTGTGMPSFLNEVPGYDELLNYRITE